MKKVKTSKLNENKKEEKKIISLYKYHKSKFIAWLLIFISFSFFSITNMAHISKKIWIIIPTAIIIAITFIFIILWLINELSRKAEKMDELAMENMNKAHKQMGSIFIMILGIIFVTAIIWDSFFNKSINVSINGSMLTYTYMMLYSAYNSLESGLFIYNEGKESIVGEDE